MTLQQYTESNKAELTANWHGGENEDFANFESYCFYEWQNSGDCTVN